MRQTDAELQRVLSCPDLSWSPDVMTFHARGDPVRSPTYAAVARPVHKEASGRWRRYAALIEPLEMQLAKIIRKDGVNL